MPLTHKQCALKLYGYHNTERTYAGSTADSQRDRMDTKNGSNVLVSEKLMFSISRKPRDLKREKVMVTAKRE